VVAVAQLVELLVVVQAVAGSNPVSHPLQKCLQSGNFGSAMETETIASFPGHEEPSI
jgi:hypothetical protein